MSTGTRHTAKDAVAAALQVVDALRPHVDRIVVAGSLRRRCLDVGDIEIVIIPKPYEVGLFGSGIATVLEPMEKVKGDLGPGCRYTKRIHQPSGIAIDVFMAKPKNWGYILAIRTGSAEFSKWLASMWVKKGYHGVDGYLMKGRNIIAVPEEERLFELLGLQYIEPWKRNNCPVY